MSRVTLPPVFTDDPVLMRMILIGILCLATFFVSAQDRLSGKAFTTRSEVLALNGMVAANHPLAAQTGLEVLKNGGTAVDAAIAANAMMGLVDPAMNGIGGDLFAIVWDAATQQLYGLNASGRSASDMSYDNLKEHVDNGQSFRTGPLSVTTPGCVDGWFALHERFGKTPMDQLLTPTIRYAREGVPITEEVADNFKMLERDIQESENPTFKALYFVDGHFPRKGHVFRNPELANSLQLIAEQGRDAFYKGDIARGIVEHLSSTDSKLQLSDLAAHKSEWVEPVSVNYRGYDIHEIPPNGQGMSVLQILNILEEFDIASMEYGSSEYIHHLVEAKKLAYEDMVLLYGDQEFGEIPIDKLLSDEYARERAALIDPNRTGVYDPGVQSGGHTIYLTAADKEGNMISLIQSNSSLFGSKEVPEGLGFPLQNRGQGFTLEPDKLNTYAPDKRPFHTIIPAFITKDGEPFISFGLMGGDMQPIGHVQVVLNLIDFGMNLQEAGDAPRVYHSGTIVRRGHVDNAGNTFLESGFPYETISGLMDKGHVIRMAKGIFGGYQAIMLKDGVYYGATESRKDGQAAGY